MISCRWLLLCFFLVGFLLSCSQRFNPKDSEEISARQLDGYVYGPIGYYSTRFEGVFYAGSDDHFDYITIRNRGDITRVFKLRRGEVAIRDRMPIEFKSVKWVNITKGFPFPPSHDAR